MALRSSKTDSETLSGSAETRFLIHGERVEQTLRDCCMAQQRCDVILPENRCFVHAAFAHCSEDYLGLDLLDSPGIHLKGQGTCMVTFFHDGRAFIFIGRIRNHVENPGQEPDRLMLEFPDQITTTQVRRTPRIPVASVQDLQVLLRNSSGRTWKPAILDISLGGMLVEFARDDTPELEIGQRLEAKLTLEQKSVKFAAELRHSEGQRCGFFFPEVMRQGEFDPPDAYRSMVMTLEQRWLQARRQD